MVSVCGLVGAKDFFGAPRKVAEHLDYFLGVVLAGRDKILHVDVYLFQVMHLLIGGGQRPLVIFGLLGLPIYQCWRVFQPFEGLMRGCVTAIHGGISHVCNDLRIHAEIWCAVHVYHR